MSYNLKDKPMKTIEWYYILDINYLKLNNIISHNYSSSQMKVYAKNSFDRFGDDLTELILQYLTFEDKIRLECVSKQWRRLVFNKQFVFHIDCFNSVDINSIDKLFIREQRMNKLFLESILKKFPNITKVFMSTKIEFFPLIGRYCPKIKSLSNIDQQSRYRSFYVNYGHKLEELMYLSTKDVVKQILEFCPNLKKISIDFNAFIFNEDKEFLPKLEVIVERIIIGNSENVNQMKILSDKYSQTMKSMHIYLKGLTPEELKTFIDCISRLKNSSNRYCNSFIDWFHSMKNIERVSLFSHWITCQNVSMSDTKYYYFDKSLSEVMLSPNGMNVKHINDKCGLITSD